MYFPVLLQYLYQKKPRLQMILQEIRWIQAVSKTAEEVPVSESVSGVDSTDCPASPVPHAERVSIIIPTKVQFYKGLHRGNGLTGGLPPVRFSM